MPASAAARAVGAPEDELCEASTCEPSLDQWFAWRPMLGFARYRMPVEGLYLCGSGAHPGGGVTGVPGRNAAREVVADMRRGRRA